MSPHFLLRLLAGLATVRDGPLRLRIGMRQQARVFCREYSGSRMVHHNIIILGCTEVICLFSPGANHVLRAQATLDFDLH